MLRRETQLCSCKARLASARDVRAVGFSRFPTEQLAQSTQTSPLLSDQRTSQHQKPMKTSRLAADQFLRVSICKNGVKMSNLASIALHFSHKARIAACICTRLKPLPKISLMPIVSKMRLPAAKGAMSKSKRSSKRVMVSPIWPQLIKRKLRPVSAFIAVIGPAAEARFA